MLSTISHTHLKNESQRSVNTFCGGSASCTTTYCIAFFLNRVISLQLSLYVPMFNFTNMHAVSHRSDCCLDCSSKVNISVLAIYFTVTLCLTATTVKLPCFQIHTTKSDSQSFNTSLLGVMITDKHERVFFMIWMILLYQSYLMLGGLLWM